MLFGPKYSPPPTATEPRSSSTIGNIAVAEMSGDETVARKRGIRYRAFGQRFTLSGSNPARRDPSFQNRTYDAGLGIYDYRNRSFDPATGRFLQRDPVLGGDSLYNPYVFPGNNPVGNVDPMGTDIVEETVRRKVLVPFQRTPKLGAKKTPRAKVCAVDPNTKVFVVRMLVRSDKGSVSGRLKDGVAVARAVMKHWDNDGKGWQVVDTKTKKKYTVHIIARVKTVHSSVTEGEIATHGRFATWDRIEWVTGQPSTGGGYSPTAKKASDEFYANKTGEFRYQTETMSRRKSQAGGFHRPAFWPEYNWYYRSGRFSYPSSWRDAMWVPPVSSDARMKEWRASARWGKWPVKGRHQWTRGNTIAHEFGHLLGLIDRYDMGLTTSTQWGWRGTIMGGTTVRKVESINIDEFFAATWRTPQMQTLGKANDPSGRRFWSGKSFAGIQDVTMNIRKDKNAAKLFKYR